MKVRVKYMRVFDKYFHTILYDIVSKTEEMHDRYHFFGGGFETVALWKVTFKYINN